MRQNSGKASQCTWRESGSYARILLIQHLATVWMTCYSMNEGLLIITTVVEGLANKILVTTVGSYVRQVPFLFIAFRDTVIHYLQHDPTHQNDTLNVIEVNCWKCGGPHYIRKCKLKSCYKFGAIMIKMIVKRAHYKLWYTWSHSFQPKSSFNCKCFW